MRVYIGRQMSRGFCGFQAFRTDKWPDLVYLGDTNPIHMNTKRCIVCKRIKSASEFNRCQEHRDGLRGDCRACQRDYHRIWYQKNIERQRRRAREDGKTDRVKERRKDRYHTDEEYRLKRREQCRRSKQKESSKQKDREYKRTKRATDPHFRLRENISRRIRDVLMGESKSAPTMVLMDCSMEHLRLHLESLWKPGMSWENWGVRGWHIDHIRPCASFDLTDPEQQKVCFHWTNLQPLWARENWAKGDRETK